MLNEPSTPDTAVNVFLLSVGSVSVTVTPLYSLPPSNFTSPVTTPLDRVKDGITTLLVESLTTIVSTL